MQMHFSVIEFTADEMVRVEDTGKDSIGLESENIKEALTCSRVHGDSVFKTLIIGEGDIGRSCAVSLVIGDDLNTIVLPRIRNEKR